LFIPGGILHAIGEGIFMVEIMEPSDLAVRFEFERAGYTPVSYTHLTLPTSDLV